MYDVTCSSADASYYWIYYFEKVKRRRQRWMSSVHVFVPPMCDCDHTHVLDNFLSLLMAMQHGQCNANAWMTPRSKMCTEKRNETNIEMRKNEIWIMKIDDKRTFVYTTTMADAHENVAYGIRYTCRWIEWTGEHTNSTRQAHAHAYHTLVQRIKMTTNGYGNYSFVIVMHEVEQVRRRRKNENDKKWMGDIVSVTPLTLLST